jgi:hypothetical protein
MPEERRFLQNSNASCSHKTSPNTWPTASRDLRPLGSQTGGYLGRKLAQSQQVAGHIHELRTIFHGTGVAAAGFYPIGGRDVQEPHRIGVGGANLWIDSE